MVRYVLFDLDETLYPVSSGLMPAIGERMRAWLQATYQLDVEAALALQKRYWNDYGTTLRGLMVEQQVDPRDYLLYVHDVDVAQFLAPDERLRRVLQQIPFSKVIVTNADRPHAERVLERLGIADQFAQIFDIVFMEYECKPSRGAYERVLNALGARGDECILVEDLPRNLPMARALGIRTVLLKHEYAPAQPSTWIPDPTFRPIVRECPPDANVCIPEIYRVADAIHDLSSRTPALSTLS
jgi:putative hydrolase of the HAD superfamily